MTIQPMATCVHARRPPSGGSGRTIDDWWVLLVPILSRSWASIADKFWSGAVSALQWMPLVEMKWFFADGEVGNWRCRRRYRPGRSDVRGEASHDSQGMRLYKDHLAIFLWTEEWRMLISIYIQAPISEWRNRLHLPDASNSSPWIGNHKPTRLNCAFEAHKKRWFSTIRIFRLSWSGITNGCNDQRLTERQVF